MADADHLYAADYKWWKYHIADIARDFDGQCWTCETPGKTNWGKNDPKAWGIESVVCHIGDPGLNTTKGHVSGGSNSGYQAINLAYHLGAKTVLLLGFDMHSHSGKTHWFGDHPKEFNADTEYQRFIKNYNRMRPEKYGLTVINCSPKTAVDCFKRCPIDDLLRI